MLEIDKKKLIFKIKEIWFADFPFDAENCDNVIFRACKNRAETKNFKRSEFTTLTIDLNQNLNDIWKNMDKSSCRYAIRRAERDGVKIKINQNYDEFYKINASFRENKKLPPNLHATPEFMKSCGTLFIAESNGEIIGGSFFIEDENNLRWFLGASKRLESDRKKAILIGNANRLIIWEAIKYAKQKKLKEFDLGGYYIKKAKNEQKERINIFKKSFGGKLSTHYIYEKDYSLLFKILKTIYFLLIKRDF